MDYSGKNLQGKSFRGANLVKENFKGSDLRGADFSSANLKGADFSDTKMGMRIYAKVLVFLIAMSISFFSGYIAMITGKSVQSMIQSTESLHRLAGYLTILVFIVFTGFALWKGIFRAINTVFLITICLAIVMGLFMYLTGLGTGIGALRGSIALMLLVLMFIVGTISRAAAGTLASNILFLAVAMGGATFGKSLGGGLGTVAMAMTCAVMSKRALNHENYGSIIRTIAVTISSWFGTSFKSADLSNANFSNAVVKNTNFSGANLAEVTWQNTKKQFILGDNDE